MGDMSPPPKYIIRSLFHTCKKKLSKVLSFLRFYEVPGYLNLIEDMVNMNYSDSEIAQSIKNIIENIREEGSVDIIRNNKSYDKKSHMKIIKLGRILTSAYTPLRPYKYLDFGTGDGLLANGVGVNILNIANTDIYGVDINPPEWFDTPRQKHPFNFSLVEQRTELQFSDMYFTHITCMNVLHHCEYQYETLQELFRVLNRGGLFLLKEHNCTPHMSNLLDVQHLFYAVVEDGVDPHYFIKDYYANYMSIKNWIDILEKIGFHILNIIKNRRRADGSFYLLATKK